MQTKLFFNPDCSKCREAKELLEGQSCEFELVEYLKESPSAEELQQLLKLLKLRPLDITRQNETVFKDNFEGKTLDDDAWLAVLADNPILIERPILIHNGKAIIGRPPTKILDIL